MCRPSRGCSWDGRDRLLGWNRTVLLRVLKIQGESEFSSVGPGHQLEDFTRGPGNGEDKGSWLKMAGGTRERGSRGSHVLQGWTRGSREPDQLRAQAGD